MIFLTGATGFLGSHLLRSFLQKGKEVKAFVRNTQKLNHLLESIDFHPHQLKVVEGDLTTDQPFLEKHINDVDTIVHTAALVDVGYENFQEMEKINVQTTEKILDVVQPTQYFLFVGSIAVFGPSRVKINDIPDTVPVSGTPYESSKRKSTLLVRNAQLSGKCCGILHPSIIYGKGAHGALTRFAKLVAKKQLPFFTGLNTLGSFVYIEDVVNAIQLMVDRRLQKEYLLGGDVVTFGAFLQEIAKHTNGSAPKVNLPLSTLLPISYLGKWIFSAFGKHFPLTPTMLRVAHQDWVFGNSSVQDEFNIPIHTVQEGVAKWVKDW